jgi:S-methyl-5-thioribose-1-phosphate isomerase
MKYKNKDYLTVWMKDDRIFIIEQNLLPDKFKVIELKDIAEVLKAINTMQIRGAPAIGALAAYGYALALQQSENEEIYIVMRQAYDLLLNSRPTAADLKYGLDYVKDRLKGVNKPEEIREIALKTAEEFALISIRQCRSIGDFGSTLITHNSRLLTHCNAGALAAVDYGTALSPMRIAHQNGINFFVYVSETRPRLQGARLTAWELAGEDIDHAIIIDSAAGYFMQQGKIDLVITGADRIAQNGDCANKIGTYALAVLAKENRIPFFIAAPFSTFDKYLKTGSDIIIEYRNPAEVLSIKGQQITSGLSKAINPAFDVTPAKYISGYITPRGIYNPDNFSELWKNYIQEQTF